MKIFFLLTVISSALLVSCSQSEKRVPFHHYGSQASGGSLGIHTLRKGETLWSVANAYQVDLRNILDINHFSAPYHIKVGQRLKIPAPQIYKTKTGDTLYKVSRLFDTTTTELARLNHIRAPYILKDHQSLRLPSKYIQTSHMIKEIPVAKIPQKSAIVPIEREELTSQVKPVESVETIQSLQPNGKFGFIKPVSGKIISGYGPKEDGLHNDGINIQAKRGAVVRSSESGVVVYSGKEIEGYGNMILIRHNNGYLTAYAHLEKRLIQKGDKVKRGQTIGTVGTSGNVKNPQLHFEIRKGRDALNPQQVLKI